jgi:uncharacterized protein YjbJ (UPF0337 family)
MDKNRITGAAKRAKGALKESLGRLTRNPKMEAEGKAERTAGAVRNAAGSAKDATHGGGRGGRA